MFNNTVSFVTHQLWSISTTTQLNPQLDRTVMSLNKTLSTFFPPLQELANWLAVTLTLWLVFVSIVCYCRLPAAGTQIVDHATVKRKRIILARKTGDDSGRRDGNSADNVRIWWRCDGWNPDRQTDLIICQNKSHHCIHMDYPSIGQCTGQTCERKMCIIHFEWISIFFKSHHVIFI